jgi:tRNA(adenine34) deaminase
VQSETIYQLADIAKFAIRVHPEPDPRGNAWHRVECNRPREKFNRPRTSAFALFRPRARFYHRAMPDESMLQDESPRNPLWTPREAHMRVALRQARLAAEHKEVPVGAAIFKGSRLLAQAHNLVETLKDPTAHAEIIAITQAANALGDWRLSNCVMYVTKEPCPMCAGAIILARLDMVVWGVTDPQRGGAVSQFQILQNPALNHRTDYRAGFMEEPCRALLKEFFKELRTG